MLREDLIEDITETYPAPEPAGAEPTAYLHCTRGPVAWEPEEVTRARDERIAGVALARGLGLVAIPSFVQLLSLIPDVRYRFPAFSACLCLGTGLARMVLDDWPQRPRMTLALLAAAHFLLIETAA